MSLPSCEEGFVPHVPHSDMTPDGASAGSEPSAAERQAAIAFAMYEALIRAENDLQHAYHTTRSIEDADRFEAGRDIVRAALARSEGK